MGYIRQYTVRTKETNTGGTHDERELNRDGIYPGQKRQYGRPGGRYDRGFNSLIGKQRKEEGEAVVSVVLFDDVSEVIYDREDLQKIEAMTEKQYSVRGCTALLDAVGSAIHHIANVHRCTCEEDRPAHTVFGITTDGMENASQEYSYDGVKQMIEEKRDRYSWKFIFLGANIDAAREAERFGIHASHAVQYHQDAEGVQRNYSVMSKAMSKVRKSSPVVCECSAPSVLEEADWREEADEYFRENEE